MRFLLFTLVVGVLLTGIAPVHAQSAQQLYTEAQRAYVVGDIATAKEKFSMVLAINPKHQPSINYLRMITAAEKKSGAAISRAQELASLYIPQIRFRDATLGSALDFLSQTVAKESAGKTQVNFVLQLPENYVNEKTLTLSLNNTPFTTVLQYIGQLADVSFGIEQYAIVVKPKGLAAAPEAESDTSVQ